MPKIAPLMHKNLTYPHGFFTRLGGVSDGLYASLNAGLGSADKPQNVLENRARITAYLQADALVSGQQTHSTTTALVAAPSHPPADALVTTTPRLAIGVLTADCVPVLLADNQNAVIGAAHAGWRGAHDGIIASVIETMLAQGAQKTHIRAIIGPAISAEAYEIGPEFRAIFAKNYPRDMDLFTRPHRTIKSSTHAMFDLPQFVVRQVERSGVQAVNLDFCTYNNQDRFFSYRHNSHAGQKDYGRQISAICLPAK